MGDPNWLLSTAAQSTAAFVAIIGGFLVTRVVALAADRSRATSELSRVRSHLSLKENEAAALRSSLVRAGALAHLDEHRSDLLKKPGAGFSSFIKAHPPPPSVPTSALNEVFVEYTNEIKRAYQAILPAFKDRRPESLADAVKETAVTVAHEWEDLWEDAFKKVRRMERPQTFDPSWLPRIEPELLDDLLGNIEPRANQFDALAARRQREHDLARLEAEVALLQLESTRLDQEVAAARPPREIWFGVGVLSYFSLVGIVWPMCVMADVVIAHSPHWREWLLGAFVSGLLSVVAYWSRPFPAYGRVATTVLLVRHQVIWAES